MAKPVELLDPEQAWLTLYALDQGRPVGPEALAAAITDRRVLEGALADLFSDVDALITPTTPQTAYPFSEYEAHHSSGLCWAFNLSGHPAISVPVGLLDGLPVGAQIVAPPHRDDVAVRVARLLDISPLPRGG